MDEKERILLERVNLLIRRAEKVCQEEAKQGGLIPVSITNLSDAARDLTSWIQRNPRFHIVNGK